MSIENSSPVEAGYNKLFSPRQYFSLKNRPAIFGAVTFIILSLLIFLLVYQRFLSRRESKALATREYVISVKEKLQELLAKSIVATKTLSFFIQPGKPVAEFEKVAAQILADNPNIDGIQMAPAGVITQVFPLKGNEAVIGYDVLKDPRRNKEALKAIQNKDFFFAGPFVLKQGGTGIVGRLPVYVGNKFWGFSAVIIKLANLVHAVGIDQAEKNGFYFQLSKINPDTGEEEYFITPPTGRLTGNLTTVLVPRADWKLSAIPVNKSAGYADIFWLGLLGLLFSAMGGIFIYTVMRSPEKLKNLVKKRTTELADSEERYRSLIEQASDGIIVYSFEGKIFEFNKRAYEESGYTKEEFAKLNLKDLLSNRKLTMRQEKADAIQSGKTAMIERQLIRKDGSLIDIEINVSMLPDANLVAFVRNITERKNAERAIKESEQKFSRAFQTELMGFAIINMDDIVIDTNDSYARMFGTNRDQVIGRSSMETGLLNDANEKVVKDLQHTIQSVLRENAIVKNLEIELHSAQQGDICLLISIVPLVLNGSQNCMITAIDITDKKATELSLLKSETKYRSLIEQASDGIVISDFNGIIIEVNKSICKMSGFTSAEMLGKSIEEFLPKEDLIANPIRIAELMEGKSLLYERRLLKKNGELLDVEVNSSMAGKNALIGFIRDISERKKAAAELKTSHDRFDIVARATNDAIWHHDFITDVTSGNENLYNLYEFTQGEDIINYGTFLERVHPDERERLLMNLRRHIEKKRVSIAEEFRFRNQDGSYKNIYDRAFIIYDSEGLPVQIMGVMQDITQRVNSEKAILKEKELSDSIINSLPAVFFLYNKSGKLLRWNTNFEIVTGYTGKEIAELDPFKLFYDDDKQLLAERIRQVFEIGHETIEAQLLTREQKKIPYYFSGRKIDYQGEPCLMGFGLDFTDKVKAQQAIKDSEEKFRSLVEEALDAVTILSPEGVISYVSPAVERILGYKPEEILQLNVFSIIHPQSVNEIKKIFAQAMQNPGVPIKGHHCRVLHKEGTWRWLEKTVTSMHHISSINGIVENFRDVTDRIDIQKNIIAEKELSDSIINSLPGIFYLHDHTGKFIRWNDNFESITGYSALEISQLHPEQIFGESVGDLLKENTNGEPEQKTTGSELFLMTKDNVQIPFFYKSISIEYKGIPGIMGMGFDVTDRKKIEEQLMVSNQQLEHKAAELISSYTELERFAYIVSHDLQEPLRMVSSFLTLLEKKYKGQLDETGEKYIYFAVDGAERMKHLIMDLLEYSRTGTNKDVATDTDMNELVNEVLRVLKGSIEEEGAIIEVDNLPVLPNTSRIQMFQLMQNLVGNALKYRGKNTPHIRIGVAEESKHWVFSVTDNGIGIDPLFFDKIFIIFQRLHNKGEFSGTGIGLSICKKIVEKHGGKIWVESTPGSGSTFYFTINKNRNALLN